MKIILSILCLALSLATVEAQQYLGTNGPSYPANAGGGLIGTIINGGTNSLPGLTTNIYGVTVTNTGGNGISAVSTFPTVILACPYQRNAGLNIYESCPGNSAATNGATIYALNRSFDNGATFETTPFWYVTNTPFTAANGWTNDFIWDIPLTNATHVAITSGANTGTAAVTRTNVAFYWDLKNDTVWAITPPH